MNDVILKSILETSIECDKMIDDFFYLEKCKEFYESEDSDDKEKEKTNSFINLLKNICDKILRMIAHVFDTIGKLFGSDKDNISPKEFRSSEIPDIVVRDYNEEIIRETKIQCKLANKLIDKIVATDRFDEEEVTAFLNRGARFLNSKEGQHKIKAAIAPTAYILTKELKNDTYKNLKDFDSYKGKKLSESSKLAISRIFRAKKDILCTYCTWSNQYFKEYNRIVKKEEKKK